MATIPLKLPTYRAHDRSSKIKTQSSYQFHLFHSKVCLLYDGFVDNAKASLPQQICFVETIGALFDTFIRELLGVG